MTKLEKKAREIVRDAYFEYRNACEYNSNRDFAWSDYIAKLEMLEQLFPDTTNSDALRDKWYSMWYKENH